MPRDELPPIKDSKTIKPTILMLDRESAINYPWYDIIPVYQSFIKSEYKLPDSISFLIPRFTRPTFLALFDLVIGFPRSIADIFMPLRDVGMLCYCCVPYVTFYFIFIFYSIIRLISFDALLNTNTKRNSCPPLSLKFNHRCAGINHLRRKRKIMSLYVQVLMYHYLNLLFLFSVLRSLSST